MTIISEDNKDILFSNYPIFVDNIPIYSPLLKDIFDRKTGVQTYLKHISLCTFTKDGISDDKYKDYEFEFSAIYDFYKAGGIVDDFLASIKFFTGLDFAEEKVKDDIVLYANIEEDIVILHNYNFINFQNAIRFVNCIQLPEKPKPKTKHELLVEEAKRKIEKQTGKKIESEESDISLRDYISSFCVSSHSYNLLNVWDLSLYQFLEQLKRSQAYEKFNLDIRSLLAGADSKEIDLKYYMSNLDKD
jgi:hypothetical protein